VSRQSGERQWPLRSLRTAFCSLRSDNSLLEHRLRVVTAIVVSQFSFAGALAVHPSRRRRSHKLNLRFNEHHRVPFQPRGGSGFNRSCSSMWSWCSFGAPIVEFVAKKHYERAQNFAVRGFEYLAEEDQYRCPEGEHLKLLTQDNENRPSAYQISTSCQLCRLKNLARRTATSGKLRVHLPHGRRSRWENSTGAFRAIMFLAATLVCALCPLLWAGKPGTGLFVITQVGV
jgi:hypothetical protein